jgi:DNA-binding winged helix-turn-helix (wHTH) protein
VAQWRVYAEDSSTARHPIVTVPRSGFETVTRIAATAVVSAEALDASGQVLGSTAVV